MFPQHTRFGRAWTPSLNHLSHHHHPPSVFIAAVLRLNIPSPLFFFFFLLRACLYQQKAGDFMHELTSTVRAHTHRLSHTHTYVHSGCGEALFTVNPRRSNQRPFLQIKGGAGLTLRPETPGGFQMSRGQCMSMSGPGPVIQLTEEWVR